MHSPSGFPKAKIRTSARLHPFLGALGKNPPPGSMRLLSEFSCFPLRDRGPVSLLSVKGYSGQACPFLVARPLLCPECSGSICPMANPPSSDPLTSPVSDLQTHSSVKASCAQARCTWKTSLSQSQLTESYLPQQQPLPAVVDQLLIQ